MHTYESMSVGDQHAVSRTITAEDVRLFAQVSGDDNPIHLDEVYAAQHAPGGKPIVHGVLLLSIVSKVLGRDYPGAGSVAVSISAKFLRPVPVGSDVTIEVRVAEKIERFKHIKMKIYGYFNGKMVVGGEAVLIPPTMGE